MVEFWNEFHYTRFNDLFGVSREASEAHLPLICARAIQPHIECCRNGKSISALRIANFLLIFLLHG